MKTVSGAKKRFSLTAAGKIKRKHACKSHLMRKKDKKRKKNLGKTTYVHKSDENNIKDMLAV